MKRTALLVIVLVGILVTACSTPPPTPTPAPTREFPTAKWEVDSYCDNAGGIKGLLESKGGGIRTYFGLNWTLDKSYFRTVTRLHWRPCPGVPCEVKVTWKGPYGSEETFTTSDANRYIEGSTLYDSVEFVCQ
jgi:hypothetical protein